MSFYSPESSANKTHFHIYRDKQNLKLIGFKARIFFCKTKHTHLIASSWNHRGRGGKTGAKMMIQNLENIQKKKTTRMKSNCLLFLSHIMRIHLLSGLISTPLPSIGLK